MVAALDLDKSPLERLENQSINIYRCQDDLDKEKRLIQSVCAGGKRKEGKSASVEKRELSVNVEINQFPHLFLLQFWRAVSWQKKVLVFSK